MAIAVLLASGIAPESRPVQAQEASEQPNIVLILTDDQRTGDLKHMPNVQKLLVQEGTTFERFTISQPRCCPSRATFLTGRYSHNHRTGFGGGTARFFAKSGAHGDTYATRLNGAGYRTGYFGKYMNGYEQTRGTPPGWDTFYANVDRDVWSRCFNADGHGKKCKKSGNMDAFYGERTASFVEGSGPFLAVYAPNAPHQDQNGPPPAPESAIRHLKDPALPKPPSFNERNVSDKPGFIKNNRRLGGHEIKAMAREHRARLGSLQVVDRYVGQVVSNLERSGELSDTYFFFVTDNGYHMGQHRLEAGKGTPYVEDVIFPLVVRGPGVRDDAGPAKPELVQNTDLAPTFAELAGVSAPAKADGTSFAPLIGHSVGGRVDIPWRDAALVEFPGKKGFYGLISSQNETYVEWNNGFREYYDLDNDPYQLDNAFKSKAVPSPDTQRVAELEAQLEQMQSCKANTANTCQDPGARTTP